MIRTEFQIDDVVYWIEIRNFGVKHEIPSFEIKSGKVWDIIENNKGTMSYVIGDEEHIQRVLKSTGIFHSDLSCLKENISKLGVLLKSMRQHMKKNADK